MIRFLNKGVSGINTSDATAIADDILSPKTAYVNNKKIEGNILKIEKPPHGKGNYLSSVLKNIKYVNLYDIYTANNVTMFIYVADNLLNCILIKDNEVIKEETFDISSFFTFTTIQAVALNIVNYTEDVMIFEVGVSYMSSSTYKYSFNTLNVDLKNYDITMGTKCATLFNGSTGSVGTLWAIKTVPGRFVSVVKNNADDYFLYVKVDRNTNTARVYETNQWHEYYYNPDANITGNYKWLVQDQYIMYLDPESSKISNYNNPTGTNKVFISPKNKYIYVNNELYAITPSSNFTTMYNSKVYIQTINAKEIYFSANEEYMYVKSEDSLDIYSINGNDVKCLQSVTISNYNIIPSNEDILFFLWNLYSNTLELFYISSSTYVLEGLIRNGQNFIRLSSEYVPNANNVLENVVFKDANGNYINGTMPNNGELNYTPSDTEQLIPAGYTTGGKILKTDITTLAEYEDCLTYSKAIMTHLENSIYTNLTYIQSSGQQYIDTSFIPNKNTKIVLGISDVSDDGTGIIGACTKWDVNSFLFYIYGGSLRWTYKDDILVTSDTNAYHDVELYRNSCKIDGTIVSSDTSDYTSTINKNLEIFRGGNRCTSCKLYYCKIYDNEILVKDLVPVKDENGIICLFDKIERKYFYNQGSGSFIGGTEI